VIQIKEVEKIVEIVVFKDTMEIIKQPKEPKIIVPKEIVVD
jgi:hypothetical protein